MTNRHQSKHRNVNMPCFPSIPCPKLMQEIIRLWWRLDITLGKLMDQIWDIHPTPNYSACDVCQLSVDTIPPHLLLWLLDQSQCWKKTQLWMETSAIWRSSLCDYSHFFSSSIFIWKGPIFCCKGQGAWTVQSVHEVPARADCCVTVKSWTLS